MKGKLYGFEDYKLVQISEDYIDGIQHAYSPYVYDLTGYYVEYNRRFNIEVDYGYHSKFTELPYKDNKELLNQDSKVYIHPSCKISRSLVANKFKKVLDPWKADIVVLPEPDSWNTSIKEYALFINENKKLIVALYPYSTSIKENLQSLSEGTPLSSLLSTPLEYLDNDASDTLFMSYTKLLNISENSKHLFDVFTNQIPINNSVYEESLQEALGDADNKVTLQMLLSIRDMLSSADEDTVGAGLKALATLDYMKYSNSIRYLFHQNTFSRIRYNKAMNSTAVKFMRKQIFGDYVNDMVYGGRYDEDIYEDDYNLLTELLLHDGKIDNPSVQEICNKLYYLPFVDECNYIINYKNV